MVLVGINRTQWGIKELFDSDYQLKNPSWSSLTTSCTGASTYKVSSVKSKNRLYFYTIVLSIKYLASVSRPLIKVGRWH